MIIKNFQDLSTTPQRKLALEVAETGLLAIDTKLAINRLISLQGDKLTIENRKITLAADQKIFVVAVGKCALEACQKLEEILGDRLTAGVAVDIHQGTLNKIKLYTGSHPLPTNQNVDATAEIIKLLKDKTEKDIVLFVISGGGSTLLCQPNNISCLDEGNLVSQLFHKGAAIQQINIIRKHLSLARGGYLAGYAFPAQCYSLIFSDVPGNDFGSIASGPTVLDQTTINDAKAVLEEIGLTQLEGLIETPKEPRLFEKMVNILAVSNMTALEAMSQKSLELGLSPQIVTDKLTGEAQEVGKETVKTLHASLPGQINLYGGETTVTITGAGKGGRNQELALSSLNELLPDELILTLASDGRDNTDHAGALVDVNTLEKSRSLELDPKSFLEGNNSYEFFEKTGDFILTNETGANVSDLVLAFKKSLN